MSTKNLGNVRALISSAVAPTNKNLIWQDTSVIPYVKKIWNNSLNVWEELSATGGGEVNTASSVGTGESVYKEKVGVDLRFKSIKAGSNVSISSNANEVIINSIGGGSGTAAALWEAKTYTQPLSEVYYITSGKYNLYVLVEPTPFVSSNFETELLAGSWQLSSSNNHQDLTLESRNAVGAHPNLEAALATEIQRSVSVDTSLQNQIFNMQENDPIQQIRYLTSEDIVLNSETLYQSKAEKGSNPAFEITSNVTATDAETANVVASWVGIALTNELELIDQITQLFIKARKNSTKRTVVMFARFYDRTSDGIKTLKGTSSQVILTDTTTSYDLYFPIQAYLAAVGSRGQIDILGFQTGAGAAAQITTVIEGDYYSRWSYTIPAGSLSSLDEKLISTQALPSLNLLAGATQKEVNGAQNTLNANHEQRITSAETQLAGNQLTFASIYGYYNFI